MCIQANEAAITLARKPEEYICGDYSKGTLLTWCPSAIKQVARSMLAAEAYAVAESQEADEWVRNMFSEVYGKGRSLRYVEKDAEARFLRAATDSDNLRKNLRAVMQAAPRRRRHAQGGTHRPPWQPPQLGADMAHACRWAHHAHAFRRRSSVSSRHEEVHLCPSRWHGRQQAQARHRCPAHKPTASTRAGQQGTPDNVPAGATGLGWKQDSAGVLIYVSWMALALLAAVAALFCGCAAGRLPWKVKRSRCIAPG